MAKEIKMPYNLEEEQIVLGIMLCDEVALVEALSDLKVEDFYEGFAANRLIFAALERIYAKNLRVCEEISFLIEELRLANELETVGGVEYISLIMSKVTTVVNLQDHIKILKDNRSLRELLKLIKKTETKYIEHGAGNIQDFIDEFVRDARDINDSRRISKFITTGELVNRFIEEMPNLKKNATNSVIAFNGVTTGYDDLDESVNGFKRGEYILIAGRPSMGKTAVALNIALRSAKRTGRPVGFFSLEMPNDLLLQRMLSADSRVSSNKIRTGNITADDEAKLQTSYEVLKSTKIFIDDSTNNTVLEIVAKATKLKNSHPDLSMIFIDYLGFIVGDSKLKSETEKVNEISRQLKNLAKTLEVPVIVLCQLNRNAEARTSNKPQLSDLRSSGSLEQDADIVILLYREGYYLMEKDTKRTLSETENQKKLYEQKLRENGLSMMELIIAKNRTGKQYNNCLLLFELEFSRFDGIDRSEKEKITQLFLGGNSGE